ncbi:WW domain-binding protein 4 [Patella vulgata]|uniref:WW domain-binding protein 4 n=1 Tax=Patella vulgata TaxID=6465 RepID=UPI00218028FE|nr:WW domain-binding protein 4 [Patella vulgata]
MSEYWKSNPRKFCDFCKCWISDNKPSIEFHERGKRHKENVQNKITAVRKSSEKKAKEKSELENDLQQMEKAALEAFKQDLQNNPALADQYRAKAQAAREAQAAEEKKNSKPLKKEKSVELISQQDIDTEGVWYEAVSDEGYPYYWNSITNQPVWEAPEKYVSISEQEKEQVEERVTPEKEDTPLNTGDIPLPEEEPLPPGTEDDVPESEEIVDIPVQLHEDPHSARSFYGGWQTVTVAEVPVPPEELLVEDIPLPEPPTEDKPKKQKFREKTVTSLSSKPGEVVGFKKRKIASGARNTRRRDDDD